MDSLTDGQIDDIAHGLLLPNVEAVGLMMDELRISDTQKWVHMHMALAIQQHRAAPSNVIVIPT